MAAAMALDAASLVRSLKTDLGTIVRWSGNEAFSEEEFLTLAQRMRRHLNALEAEVGVPEQIDLTDLGERIGALLDSGQLQPASALLEALPDRCRTYGQFTVIDGDLPPAEHP